MPTQSYDSPPRSIDSNAADDCDDDLQNLDWLQSFNLVQTDLLSPDLLNRQHGDSGNATERRSPSLLASDKIVEIPPLSSAHAKIRDFETATPSGLRDGVRFATTNLRPSVDNAFQSSRRKPFQCTFNCMVFRAIEASPYKALQLRSIYDWISEKHSYFKTAGRQWHNSVRHSLSLNKCFYRLNIDLPDESGTKCNRSSWWTVHPDYRKAFSKLVLDDGPGHRCLPRGVMIGAEIDSVKKLSRSSETELATLANDIKAAAAILTLSQKNSNPQHMKDIVDGVAETKFIVKPNSVVEIPPQRVPFARHTRNATLHKSKNQIRIVANVDSKKSRRKRKLSTHAFSLDDDDCRTRERCSVETQTDEIRIPNGNCIVEHLNYGGAVKIEFDLDAYDSKVSCPVGEDSIEDTVNCLMTDDASSNVEQIEKSQITNNNNNIHVFPNGRRRPRKTLTGGRRKIKGEDTVVAATTESWHSADRLLKLVGQKCPMDQELV